MYIRPMTAAYAMGEMGRPAVAKGEKRGPASFFTSVQDLVTLGQSMPAGGLYSAKPVFKIMGAVELMSDDFDLSDSMADFDDTPILL